MNLNDVSRIVGRRTTLKYLAIGLAGSFVAACDGRSASPGTTGQATAAGGQARTPVAVAFANFVQRSWRVAFTTTNPPGQQAAGSLVVRPDSWSLLWDNEHYQGDQGGDIMNRGTWSQESGHLTVRAIFHRGKDLSVSPAFGAVVPASIATGLFASVDWNPGTRDHLPLQFTYTDPTVKIVAKDGNGTLTISARPAVVRFDSEQRFQPVAPTPEATIRAVEAYAVKAYATGDLSAMDNYFASRQDPLYKNAYDYIVTQNQVGKDSWTITSLDLLSVTANKMVALITVQHTYNQQDPQSGTSKSTYSVIHGRWHLTGIVDCIPSLTAELPWPSTA